MSRKPSIPSRRAAAALSLGAVLALTACLVTALVTAPAASAQVQVQGSQATEVIALEARVRYLDTGEVVDYQIQPAEHVQLDVGDRVRISLVGTAIVNGRGVEVDVPARFEVIADPWRIDVSPAGPNSVTVVARHPNEEHRGDPESLSQLRYVVQGNYDVKPRLREGRITFDIGPDGRVGGPVRPPADDRWAMAQEIARDLAYVSLEDRPRPLDDYWVEKIYLQGYSGVREAAVSLAEYARREGTVQRMDPEEVVARLYRHLLGREGSARQLADRDPEGFYGNVRKLRSNGYTSLVRTFVQSEEFQEVHDVDRLQRMTRGYDRPRFEPPGRPWDDRDDRRPVPRDTRPPGL